MSVAPSDLVCPPVCLSFGGGSLLKGASDRVAASVMTVFTHWVVQGATWLVVHAIGLMAPETKARLDAKWFAPREGSMARIALLLVGPLLTVATIGAIVHQDGRRLVRIWAVGLPIAVLCLSTAIALTNLALEVVDELCRLITPAHAYKPILGIGDSLTSHGAPAFVQCMIALFIVFGALALWMEMVLRSAVLYIAVFFLPLGLATFIWPATSHITRRFVELIVTVIGSKFVIVATLTLGARLIGLHSVDGAITGTAILLLAAFAPYSLLRLVPLVEAATISHLEGTSHRPGRAAGQAGGSAVSSGRRAAGAITGLVSGPEGGLATGAVSAMDIGERAGDWVPPTPSAGGGTAAGSPRSADADAPSSPPTASVPGSSPTAAQSTAAASNAAPSNVSSSMASTAGAAPSNVSSSMASAAGAAPPVVTVPWVASTPVRDMGAGADPEALSAPVVAALPRVVPGSAGGDLDGWSDDE